MLNAPVRDMSVCFPYFASIADWTPPQGFAGPVPSLVLRARRGLRARLAYVVDAEAGTKSVQAALPCPIAASVGA
ncbi:hypothetical protein [Streptomyces sp. YIM 121038]|uniref:hypothetical protein n=1 Tax=Streptomyces sp. YIM 121038 TaxID=2136401 RepID=UPI0011103292|nr:hypothetical protein [Streptomyces sp. YIM 121038]